MNNTGRVNVRIRIPVKGRNRSLIEREIMSYFKGMPDVMTVQEAAKALRCSKNTVYSLIADGRIQAIRIGRCFKVPKTALVEFMSAEKNYYIISPYYTDCLWTSGRKCDISVVGNAKKSGVNSRKTVKGA